MATLAARNHDSSLHLNPQLFVYATAAPVLIGFTAATALWGVACAQSLVYFKKQKDGARIKRIVTTLLLLELVHFALTVHGTYYTLINCRMSPSRLKKTIWSLLAQTLPAALIVVVVRYVWIMRLWALSRSRARTVIAMIMIALALIEAILTILWMVAGLAAIVRGETVPRSRLNAMALFLVRLFNDVSVAVSFCYCLNKSKNGFQETDNVIAKLVWYGLGIGFFTSLGSVFLIIILHVWPQTTWFLAGYVVLTRAYVNSLLAMLNWRRQPIDALKKSVAEGIELSTVGWVQTVLSLGGSPDTACASAETCTVSVPESSRGHS
ncbi:hypothetical protein FIBSPDRAFT_1052257 [Athelia psychrophila]|uniref:DUF6534 domain-containing protein n=1 Tax=Athelia psychrophila TaxID=1759441 RepID=A0A165XLG2_9AGAM|nr:hypothetical protein FIBSPDRAFT_1052257 [Fibularhizoctonia sp. CBS 109695]